MSTVTARKIRDRGPTFGSRERAVASGQSVGRVYSGFLVGYPVVGRGMVIFRDPNGHRMVTTPVRRVLSDSDGDAIYVETENSVYRLEFSTVETAKEAA